MPKRLPIKDILHGLLTSLATAVRFWLHYTVVAVAWLGIVPLTAYRIYKCLFSGSASAIFTLPLDLLSTENLLSDGFYGCCVVTCTLCAFISLVWLREQILRGGPDWLNHNNNVANNANNNINNRNVNQGAAVQPNVDNEAAEGEVFENVNNNNEGDVEIAEDAPLVIPAAPEVLLDNDVAAAVMEPAVEVNPVVNDPVAPAVDEPPVNPDANALVVAGPLNAIDNNGGVGGNNGDDIGWNPDWDRAAEELTWERILGLDGSLVFVEHVFWVISLNTLFILLFAFCPYHVGSYALYKSDLVILASASQFGGLVTTVAGYVVIGVCLVFLHAITSLLKLKRTERFLGLCYVTVKVSLLSVFELGIFPLVCGWWLDVCSLPLFGAKLEDRENSLKAAPGTFMFVHWLIGMIYVFYFASFILVLREVLRPGVLWFLQNLNDPDFNPIQEMIHLPIVGHTRRFLASLVLFGSTVLLMIWFPVMIIKKVIPGLIPYNVSLSAHSHESPVGELSLEFLLLQLVLPALLDHGHVRHWLKTLIRSWCIVMSYFLDLRSYLLGDVPLRPNEAPPNPAQGQVNQEEEDSTDEEEGDPLNDRPEALPDEILPNGARIVHPHAGNEATMQPYICPKYFSARIALLLAAISLSLLIFGLVMLTVPVTTGRKLISLWMGDARIHDFNTAACGLYAGLVALRFCTLLSSWIPRGWSAITVKVREGLVFLVKLSFAGFLLLGVIPLMIGFLFDVVVIVPLRVPLNQSPVMYLMQEWAFGVLHTKVICGLAMMGEWRLKEVLEEIYHAGLMNLNLRVVVWKLAAPVIMALGLSLAVPYICVSTLCPLFGASFETETLILRRVYPTLLIVSMFAYLIHWQINKFFRLYEHIKNDKYLVGRRLVNYDPKARKAQAAAAVKNASMAVNNLPVLVLPDAPGGVNVAAAVIEQPEEAEPLNPFNDLHQRRIGDQPQAAPPFVILD